MSAYINKEEFEKKLKAMRTKYAMENNLTLQWIIYITIFVVGFVVLVAAIIISFLVMILVFMGLPLAFAEGVVKGVKKND